MKKITSMLELRESIVLLEIKQAQEGQLLKEQFKITYENLRPVNLIKNTVHELAIEPDFKGDLLTAAISLVTGYLSKKIMIGETNSSFKKLCGTLLQLGVASIVSNNTDEIKSAVSHLINNILSKKDTSDK